MLHIAKNNPECLRILICGDKGGPSTKILCEFFNCRASHSFKTAKFLGTFEGAKDDHENIELIFGPILEGVEKLQVTDLSEINIRREQNSDLDKSEKNGEKDHDSFSPKLEHETQKLQKLAQSLQNCYDDSNNVVSSDCKNCTNLIK